MYLTCEWILDFPAGVRRTPSLAPYHECIPRRRCGGRRRGRSRSVAAPETARPSPLGGPFPCADVGGVRVCNLYLPNGNPQPGPKFDYKLAWMKRLRDRLARLKALEIPAVALGDFNVIPEDKDVWSVRAMQHDALMQPESRDAYFRILNDGWTDALDTLNPRGGVWTFWDYQAGAWQRGHGFRIDHLLLSPQAADRLIAAGVDKDYRGREKASDHAPVWVELRD